MSHTLNWGIIGAGNVVEHKSGPSIALAKRSTIAAVMRRDHAKAEQYAAANDIPIATDDAKAILRNRDIDIVYIATPPVDHEHYVLAAARAGKHVLVEKPMALDSAQARRMVQACDKAGVRLFVAYYRRFYPQVQAMKRIIDEGGIGMPMAVSIEIAMPMFSRFRLARRAGDKRRRAVRGHRLAQARCCHVPPRRG